MDNQLLPIDKNIAYKLTELYRFQDNETQNIIKSLLIYFSFSYHQDDLFGYRNLDPHHFSKTMWISTANLFRKHPDPRQIQDSPLSKEELYVLEEQNGQFSKNRLWDSYLENALYILSTNPLFSVYNGTTSDKQFTGISNFILVRHVQVRSELKNKGRSTKIYYAYELDPIFERNLKRYFLQTNLSTYLLCKKKKIENIYLHVLNIYHNNKKKGINSFELNYRDLCMILNIQDKPNPYCKKVINKKFNLLSEQLETSIKGFCFHWQKRTTASRFKYSPIISWDVVDLELINRNDNLVLDNVFYTDLRHNLFNTFQTQTSNPDFGKNEYYIWLHAKEDLEIKKSCYVTVYSQHKKLTFPKPSSLAVNFFNKVMKTKTHRELELCFQRNINN